MNVSSLNVKAPTGSATFAITHHSGVLGLQSKTPDALATLFLIPKKNIADYSSSPQKIGVIEKPFQLRDQHE